MSRTDWKILGIIAVFSTVLLFFISQDSYLYDLHSRCDSAFYYMCGKAWMNGLTPYVDFADSKGPLLWFIYGLAYLLQPTNYIGVFWITCIWYTLTYFISYKIAKIFLKDSFRSLSCALVLSLFFFNPWFHNEIRVEDFGLLFMSLSLYRLCLIMYPDRVDQKTILNTFAILGFCFGALLLMKYSLAAMQAVFIICALSVLIKNHINWWKPFLFGLSGFCVITLPFVVLFLIKGNLGPFIQEYFLKTLQTVQSFDPDWCPRNILLTEYHTDNPFVLYLLEWGDLIYNPELLVLFATLILAGWLFAKKVHQYKWMPLVSSLFIFALTIRHHTDYYFNICSFLFVFVLIELFEILKIRAGRKTVLLSILVAFLVIPFHLLAYSFKTLIFNKNLNQEDFYRVSYVMSQVDEPTLVNAYEFEQGFGILSESMPAGKYWTKQNGMTSEMREEHEELILSGKADFIIINNEYDENSDFIKEEQLIDIGYKEYMRFGKSEKYSLLSKIDGLDVTDNATPSMIELFTKSTHFSVHGKN